MSEETATPRAAQSSPSPTLQVGCAVLVIAMGVFMVITMNTMKQQLDKMNGTIDAIQQTAASNSIGAFDLKDAEGNVVYGFVRKPSEVMEGEGMGMEGGACPVPADK